MEENLFKKAKLGSLDQVPTDHRHCVAFSLLSINHDRTGYIGTLAKCEMILNDKDKNPDMWFKVRDHGVFLVTSIDDIKHILTSIQTRLIADPFNDHPKVPANPNTSRVKEENDKVF